MGEYVLYLGLVGRLGCEKGVSDGGVASGGYLCGECGNLCIWEGVEGDDGEGEVAGQVGVEAGEDEGVNLGICCWVFHVILY